MKLKLFDNPSIINRVLSHSVVITEMIQLNINAITSIAFRIITFNNVILPAIMAVISDKYKPVSD